MRKLTGAESPYCTGETVIARNYEPPQLHAPTKSNHLYYLVGVIFFQM